MRLYRKVWRLVPIFFLGGCIAFNDGVREDKEIQISLQEEWSSKIGRGVGNNYSNLHPAIQGETVFVADPSGLVKALDKSDGEVKWEQSILSDSSDSSRRNPVVLSSGILVVDNSLYIGSEHGFIFSLNTSDGSVIWKTQLSSEVLSNLSASEGTLLVHTSDGLLRGLTQDSGVIEWTVDLGFSQVSLRGGSSSFISSGYAFSGSDDGYISAVNISQGKVVWQQYISQLDINHTVVSITDIDASPIVLNNTVYALPYNGNLTALDIHSGKIIWTTKVSGNLDFAIGNGIIYITDKNNTIVAVSASSGNILWRQPVLSGHSLTSPVLSYNHIVLADTDGYLYWLRTDDGFMVMKRRINRKGFYSAPVTFHDGLIIHARDGKLQTINYR